MIMQNGQISEKLENQKKSIDQIAKPLLSQKEVRAIVKDFAVAYISGKVKILHPTTEEMEAEAKKCGEIVNPPESSQSVRSGVCKQKTFHRTYCCLCG